MKYRCLIADDSTIERDLLRLLLEKTGLAEIVAECKDGLEAFKALSAHEVDIVFSDVDMPQLNGLELVRSLKQQPVFVFISSHARYALESYELDVADFILKPLQLERLLRALEKAIQFVALKRSVGRQAAISNIEDGCFFIRSAEMLVKLRRDEVAYIESAGNFSRIFTTGGEQHLTLVSLKNLEVQLAADWLVRVHRQYLVNMQHITQIEAATVRLGKAYSAPLSAQHRPGLLEKVAARVLKRNPAAE